MSYFNNDMQILKTSDLTVSGDMTLDLQSNVYDVRVYDGFSIKAKYTGSPTGTLKLQVSNDDPVNGGTQEWNDLADSSISVSAAGIYIFNVSVVFFGWVRLVWTVSSGSGTLTAKIVIKGEGENQ